MNSIILVPLVVVYLLIQFLQFPLISEDCFRLFDINFCMIIKSCFGVQMKMIIKCSIEVKLSFIPVFLDLGRRKE